MVDMSRTAFNQQLALCPARNFFVAKPVGDIISVIALRKLLVQNNPGSGGGAGAPLQATQAMADPFLT